MNTVVNMNHEIILRNLEGRVHPVNPMFATRGIHDLGIGLDALKELVDKGDVSMVTVKGVSLYKLSLSKRLAPYA